MADIAAGDQLSSPTLSVVSGYAVLDNDGFRLTPFAGGGVHWLSRTVFDRHTTVSASGCPRAGADFLWHLSNNLSYNGHEYLSLNLRIFGTFERISAIEGTPCGHTVNVRLGVSFLRNNITLKP